MCICENNMSRGYHNSLKFKKSNTNLLQSLTHLIVVVDDVHKFSKPCQEVKNKKGFNFHVNFYFHLSLQFEKKKFFFLKILQNKRESMKNRKKKCSIINIWIFYVLCFHWWFFVLLLLLLLFVAPCTQSTNKNTLKWKMK